MSAFRTPEQWEEPTPQEELGGGLVDPSRPNLRQLPSEYRVISPGQLEKSKYYQDEFGLSGEIRFITPDGRVQRAAGIAACRAALKLARERSENDGKTIAEIEQRRAKNLELQHRLVSDYWDDFEKGVLQLPLDWSHKDRS